MSETKKVYQAINRVQKALAKEGITKDRKNQQQGYNFRGIDDVYNAISGLLAENGLCILPRMVSRECIERQSAKGGTLIYTIVEAEFDFVCSEDSSSHTVRTFGEAMDSGDKSCNKAMSAAYKYAAMQTFAIPTEGDHDTENVTHELAPQPVAKPPKKKEQPAEENAVLKLLREEFKKFAGATKEDFDDLALWLTLGKHDAVGLRTASDEVLTEALTTLHDAIGKHAADPIKNPSPISIARSADSRTTL